LNFLHQFSVFVCSRRFPPIRSPFYVKLSWGLNYPSPFWLEELHANSKAVALQWLAVRYSGRGAKLSSARGEDQLLALFPTAHTDDTRATRTYVFRKSRFRARLTAMSVQHHGYFHRDSRIGAVKIRHCFVRHDRCSSSQARGNPREILNAADAPVLHGIESAVGGAKKLFGRVAVFRESRDAGADGKRGWLTLRC